MTPAQILASLDRLKAAATTEPLHAAAVRATERVAASGRRSGKPTRLTVRASDTEVTITHAPGTKALLRQALNAERPAIAQAYRTAIEQEVRR